MIIYSKFIQPSNILFIHVTCEVSKFDKFNEVNDEQPSNIHRILFTFEVLKFDKSISVISEHSRNIISQLLIKSYHINPIKLSVSFK